MTSNNAKMAEILGFQQTHLGWYDNEEVLSDEIYHQSGGNVFNEEELRFDKDYNWLMIAIQHIQSISASPEELDHIKDELWSGYTCASLLESILEAMETIKKIESEEF